MFISYLGRLPHFSLTSSRRGYNSIMPFWKLYYHFIWSTKNRLPLIDSAFEPELYRVIAAKTQDLGGFVHAVGGIVDHVHLAVSIPPKIAPAKFIGDVKGNSSHYVNHVIKPDFEFYLQDAMCYLLEKRTSPWWYDIFIIKNNTTRTGR